MTTVATIPIARGDKTITNTSVQVHIHELSSRPHLGGSTIVDLSPINVWGYIVNPDSWLVLDIAEGKSMNNAPVVVWHMKSSPADNQLWKFTSGGKIVSKLNGYVLTSSVGGTSCLTVNNCVDASTINQKWSFVATKEGPHICHYNGMVLKGTGLKGPVIVQPYDEHINSGANWVFLPI
jgi:hypothetical protein